MPITWSTLKTLRLRSILSARSLELGLDDEVLTSDHEYGALDRTWRLLSKERGFKYFRQKISLPLLTTQQFADDLWQGVTPRTRVIFLSHITSPTAILLPVAEVIRRARAQNILTIIDGAHAPGHIHLDLDSLSADFYGGNLHKWMLPSVARTCWGTGLAPDGTRHASVVPED